MKDDNGQPAGLHVRLRIAPQAEGSTLGPATELKGELSQLEVDGGQVPPPTAQAERIVRRRFAAGPRKAATAWPTPAWLASPRSPSALRDHARNQHLL